MIKRPKPTDTEDDIIEMQRSFLAEQSKNAAFQPAAKLVKVEARKRKTRFLWLIKSQIVASIQAHSIYPAAKKLSRFAQARAEKLTNTGAHERPADRPIAPPNIIIGQIVERNDSDAMPIEHSAGEPARANAVGFPKPKRIYRNVSHFATENMFTPRNRPNNRILFHFSQR